MYQRELLKADGRRLTLYGRTPLDGPLAAPSPFATPLAAHPHLRWHPLRAEWIAYAAHRQERTFLPPPAYNPLAVTRDPAQPTELPPGNWDVAVFDNRFPTLALEAEAAPALIVPSAPGRGHCEVIVYCQDPQATLGGLPLTHIDLLLAVWAERTRRLAADEEILYVLPFENRGIEVGATLSHPHGQLYAYPVVPPVPAQMQRCAREYFDVHHRGLLADLIAHELAAAERILYEGPHAVAFVPVCARYPYEVWVAPRAAVADFPALGDVERLDLARALKTVLLKYDGLWGRPFPYVMAWYQAPCDGEGHPEAHLHAEFYPPCRSRDKLKFLAGTELAAGLFAMDALPEDKARELQAVEVSVD